MGMSTRGRGGRQKLSSVVVAAKILKTEGTTNEIKNARRQLLEEAAVMAQFDNENLISLVGVVTSGDPVMVVMQYCEHGDLKGFLRSQKVMELTQNANLKILLDIVTGMACLHERKILHRDLATRNVRTHPPCCTHACHSPRCR